MSVSNSAKVNLTKYANRDKRLEKLKYIFLVVCLLVSSRLWSFHGVPDKMYDALEFLVVIGLIVITILFYHKVDRSLLIFKFNVHLFILLPLVSSVPAAIFHEQAFLLSFLMLRTIFYWLLYIVLHIFDIEPKKIINLMIFIGVVWVLITVAQQFTYPKFYFYNRDGEDGQEFYRAGLYRFMIDPLHFGIFLPIYAYCKFLNSPKLRLLILTAFGLVGLYVFSTRQFVFAVVVCIMIASFWQNGKVRLYATLVLLSIMAFVIGFKDVLLKDYIELTNEQINSKDEIRKVAAEFYLYKYWPHWLTFIFGNGIEHSNSEYGKEVMYLQDIKGLFRTDVGIIGSLNYFGVFYILNVFFLHLKGLFSKIYDTENSYLKFFFLIPLMLILITDFSYYPSAIPFFCLIFFLIDKSNPLATTRANLDKVK